MHKALTENERAKIIEQELRRFRIALEIMEQHPKVLAEFKEKASAS